MSPSCGSRPLSCLQFERFVRIQVVQRNFLDRIVAVNSVLLLADLPGNTAPGMGKIQIDLTTGPAKTVAQRFGAGWSRE